MNKNTLRAGWLCHQIKRYHMVDLKKPQDLAQHSFRVAFLASHICEISLMHGAAVNVNPMAAFYLGATHDLDEMTTGDIPTHVKTALKSKGIDITQLCDKEAFPDIPPAYKWMVKAADLIEAEHYSIANSDIADRRSLDVADHISQNRVSFMAGLTDAQRHVVSIAIESIFAVERTPGNYDLMWTDET